VDDTSHQRRDESARTNYIESRGFKILRLTNRDVAFELDWAVELIREWIMFLNQGIDPLE
jgi:very-short-patch-repair endonuclease